jgi:hypothetical protein
VSPVTVAKFAVGQELAVPSGFGYPGHFVLSLLVFSSLLSFAGFWCACLVKGTIRAALLVIPAIAFVLAALALSLSFVRVLHFTHTLDPLVLRFHPFPFPGASSTTGVEQTLGYFGGVTEWLFVPPLLVAVSQSYRLFRREAYERFFAALRPLFGIALAGLVFGYALGIQSAVVIRATQLSFDAFWEANEVIAKLSRTALKPREVAGGPTNLSVEDLSKVAPLSEASYTVLRGAVISANLEGVQGRYVTEIRFGNGLSCTPDFISRYRCEMRTGK